LAGSRAAVMIFEIAPAGALADLNRWLAARQPAAA
jgi:hypothetical protein